MRKVVFFGKVLSLVLMTSCSNADDQGKYVDWAGVVESKTTMFQPEGWDDEYWGAVYKDVDKEKIFYTILNAVLEEKIQAYDILSNEPLTLQEVKAMVANLQMLDSGEIKANQITSDDLSVIRMRESWQFDEENFRLKKQVSRIDFLLKKLDSDGAYLGDKALFYINLN